MPTMNLADPELELRDPTPNVHTLFVQFDKTFFWATLASKAAVRWSPKMYSCAGICTYRGRGDLCDIALSEPLLKLRSRRDLVETLLHEMIHAFLFVTDRNQDRDGHGPKFQAHMHRINQSAGLNITIYHYFNEEVKLYQTHWWRCNGPCQNVRPYFGIVRRAINRAPGPADAWWHVHRRHCGGTYSKIREPEQKNKTATSKNTKKNNSDQPTADITKYISNNIATNNNTSGTNGRQKPVLKDSNIITFNANNNSSSVVGKPGQVVNTPKKHIPVFTGTGFTINNNIKHISDMTNVTEHVRQIWINKIIPTSTTKAPIKPRLTAFANESGRATGEANAKKHKTENSNTEVPPAKIKKIDDYFKANASSVLKDLYGEDFKLTQSNTTTKLVAVSAKQELVECPVCSTKVATNDINRHLDECLNKEVIQNLTQDNQTAQNNQTAQGGRIVQDNRNVQGNQTVREVTQSNTNRNRPRTVVGDGTPAPASEPEPAPAPEPEPVFAPVPIPVPEPVPVFVPVPVSEPVFVPKPMPAVNEPPVNINTGAMPAVNEPPVNTNTGATPAVNEPPVNINTGAMPAVNEPPVNTNTGAMPAVNEPPVNTNTGAQFDPQAFLEFWKRDLENIFRNYNISTTQRTNIPKPAVNRTRKSDSFVTKRRGDLIKAETNQTQAIVPRVKQEPRTSGTEPVPGTSRDSQPGTSRDSQPPAPSRTSACPCCGAVLDKALEEHLDECRLLSDSSAAPTTIVIDDDDDDALDESQTLNASGTRCPCPCCMRMVEQAAMNDHLDVCLGLI